MKIVKAISILCIALLAGCSNDFQDNEVLAVPEFYVIGTNENAIGDPAIIDPYVNGGDFDVLARISKPSLGYEFDLYVSGNESIKDASKIYSIVCDDDDPDCYDPDVYAVGCTLDTDLTGNCFGQNFDLTGAFDRLPFSGYIVVEVCHRIQSRCVVDSRSVLFR